MIIFVVFGAVNKHMFNYKSRISEREVTEEFNKRTQELKPSSKKQNRKYIHGEKKTHAHGSTCKRKIKMGYTAFSQAGREKGGFRDGGMKGSEQRKRNYSTVLQPATHRKSHRK